MVAGEARMRQARSMRAAVYRELDRPALRRLLAVIGSLYVTVRRRQRCRVTHDSGVWVHRYADGIVASPTIGGPTPAMLADEAKREFLFDYEPAPGDVVVDIGAGIGGEALSFARLVGDQGLVVAIEAHPGTFQSLATNCHANGLANVRPICAAVVDRECELELGDDPHHLSNSVLAHGDRVVRVRGQPLDGILADLRLERVDLLTMNIEGAERLAMAGMEETLAVTRHAVVECHDFCASGPDDPMATSGLVREFLERNGFNVFTRPETDPAWMPYVLYASRE
jgi:FkbM family methyltransferase